MLRINGNNVSSCQTLHLNLAKDWRSHPLFHVSLLSVCLLNLLNHFLVAKELIFCQMPQLVLHLLLGGMLFPGVGSSWEFVNFLQLDNGING